MEAENIIDISKNLIFNPLHEMLLDISPDFTEFVFFNEKTNLLAITYSENFFLKITIERTQQAQEIGVTGLQIDIYDKSRMSKIDSQLICLKQVINMVTKDKRGISMNLSDQIVDSNIIMDVSCYIKQWMLFLNYAEL